MSNEYNILKVNIYGMDYPIKGNTDIDYIKKVAEYVDQKMREVDQTMSFVSTVKVAILAALNIADELFREKVEKETVITDFEDKVRKLCQTLDKSIQNGLEE